MSMLLRTRIALIVGLTSLVFALVFFAEGRMREGWADNRYRATLVAGDGNAWSGVRNSALERLEAYAGQVAQDDRVTRAVAAGDADALGKALADVQLRMRAARVPARIEVVKPDGSLLFASVAATAPRLRGDTIAEALRRGSLTRGVLRTEGDGLMVGVVAPLFSRAGPSGVVALLAEVEPLLGEIASVTSAAVFLTDPLGLPLASSARPGAALPALPQEVDQGVLTDDDNAGGRTFLVTWFPLADAWGRPAGRLATMRDVTDTSRRAALISALSLGGMVSGGVLFLAFLYWYMRRAFTPLNEVTRVLNALSRGNTSVPVMTGTHNDEIGRLAGTVETFRQAQQARERLARLSEDLTAASRLQHSILPRDFRATADYHLWALMRPAYDVGGDFYDFFDLPDGRLGFLIADVSGKGMAAALFMAMARTVIRSVAPLADTPGACLARANDLLCASNVEDGTFVTVFYGVLDPAAGRLYYANGGHNPPYLVRSDGTAQALDRPRGVALGVLDGLGYEVGELDVQPGDLLFLYTDGVTEAQSTTGAFFGDDRLAELLRAGAGAQAEAAIQRVVGAVDSFADGAPQADDITCLAVGFRNGGAVL